MPDGEGPHKACPFYYQLDHLGTPQELTDYGGEIVWSARYNAYGKITDLTHGASEQLDQPLRFQGQYFDAGSGLHYNRHRYYEPGVGRYLTPDPVKLAGGLNPYRYVPNPTGWVDPLGLSTCPGGDGCAKPAAGEQSPVVSDGGPKTPGGQVPYLKRDITLKLMRASQLKLRTRPASGKSFWARALIQIPIHGQNNLI